MSDELRSYERLIMIRSIVAAIVIMACVAPAVVPDRMDILCGLALGFVFSVLKLRLQVRNLMRFGLYAKTGDTRKATGYLMSRTMLNFATIAAALAIAAMRPKRFDLLATGAGLFLTNVVIVGNEIFKRAFGRAGN